MGPRTNREILTGGKKYHQRQSKKFGVDEVVFDKSSRQEYLTGFHKRKLERKKKAQEFHKEQERLAKIEERKQDRDERQRNFEEQLSQMKAAKGLALDVAGESDKDDSDNEWTGFGETEEGKVVDDAENLDASQDEEELKGILLRKQVYKIEDPQVLGDAVVDEETTVVVESLENPYSASLAQRSLEAAAKANNVSLEKLEEVLEKSINRAKKYAIVCGVSKPKPKPQKKKKFRYLTKSERHANNAKAKLNKMKNRKRD
ncbi:CIC11C00000005094 [Sungouiella intermedia]|uniref:CIC11C00000005094 n=1 Tax=Sungouiella intermedia TaxID=45354 RepID=A0A1L0BBN9_9ASCO|nr:CIC11C00000005094 [[Candida] intermedia]